jgi:hypothetical protein
VVFVAISIELKRKRLQACQAPLYGCKQGERFSRSGSSVMDASRLSSSWKASIPVRYPGSSPYRTGPDSVAVVICLPLMFDLALHGLEVSRDAVHTNCQGVDEIKALAVLGKDRRKHA